ncbi:MULTISPECIES: hypothetical protein [unclassified Massilia]|uniref:hypothetical protein n=1 Tax=unclassified Massilia TaxID=2609279 RepID=UPI001B816A8C|nr:MULTISPECIES: hypothetical protein [unclassified Massilia]MBQ5942770.1 hypothetical protein [Massilia sp. AB1]MBQ5963997.1 hypothetical protein [Massilia sp. ZL223]
MQVECIHFDEVFDVAAQRGDFSFRSQGRAQFGVNLHNHVVPRQGATYAIAFGRRGDWSTVLGWRDLASPAVGLKLPGWWAILSSLVNIFYVAPILIVLALQVAGTTAALAVAVAALCFMLYRVVYLLRRNRAVKRALRKAGTAP